MKLLQKLDDFLYKKVIRSIFFTSWIGRRVVMGYADSAVNFAHIYRNEAKGHGRLGKVIDKVLLNLPTARATRARRKNIIHILDNEINRNAKNEKKTRIVDLASGPATYLIDVINQHNQKHVEALCIDTDKRSIDLGRKMAQGKPIMYSRGDVSRLLPYRRISKEREWAPNTILASGLVFYYNDAFAANLFRQMHEVLEDGGLFLFDNIIGNPNKKLLSKICVTRSGTPWEFYYRRPEQIVPWLSKAGFAKVDYATDPWNMYVLYQARKTDKRQ